MLKGIKFTFKNQKLQTPQNICSHCACNWHYQHLLISPLCSTCPIMKYAWERNRPEDFFSLTQRYLRGRQEDFWDIREVWPSLCQLDLRKITQIWYSYQLVSTLVSSHMQECSSRAYRSIHTYIPTNKPEKNLKKSHNPTNSDMSFPMAKRKQEKVHYHQGLSQPLHSGCRHICIFL